MGLTDVILFLEEARNVRNYALKNKVHKDIPEEEKNRHLEIIRDKLKLIGEKHGDMTGPERNYLLALMSEYGVTDFVPLHKSSSRELSKEELRILDTPLNDVDDMTAGLNLKIKSYFASRKDKKEVIYLGDLVQLNGQELLYKCRNFGKKSHDELKKVIMNYGFFLGENINYVRPEERRKE